MIKKDGAGHLHRGLSRRSFIESTANQLQYLPSDLLSLLNINQEIASRVVDQDPAWLARQRSNGKTNLDHLQERWLSWRAQ